MNVEKQQQEWIEKELDNVQGLFSGISSRVKSMHRTFYIRSTSSSFSVITTRIGGPDDSLYAKSRQLWELLPRGCSQVYDTFTGRQVGTVQGLRKFGYYNDRDSAPYGDYRAADSICAMIKENGENAQVSAFEHDGILYWVAGSKNVHIIFRTANDLSHEQYHDQRYSFALPIARWVCDNAPTDFQQWLAENKYTACGEALFRDSRHLVDYGEVEDHIRFFAVTQSASVDLNQFGITALSPPQFSKLFSEKFGLKVAQSYRVISCKDPDQVKQLMVDIASLQNCEGCVLNWTRHTGSQLNSSNQEFQEQVVYMCKVKSVSYALERCIRQATFRQLDEAKVRQAVLSTAAKLEPECGQEAIDLWMSQRLESMIKFSQWLIQSKQIDEHNRDIIQPKWLELLNEFMELDQKIVQQQLQSSQKNLNERQQGSDHNKPVVIALRGLPLSGKSTVARALFVILKRLGNSVVWINQDELGNKKRYLNAVKHAYQQSSVKYIILDKTNRATEHLLDIVDICGRIDYLFTFVHPQDQPDEDGAGQNAIKLCQSRFSHRQDGHRSIGQDDDIVKILNIMAKMSISSQKLLRFAVTLKDIDMTLNTDDIAAQILKDISIPSSNIKLIQQSIEVSHYYEKCLSQLNGQRYIFFGIFFEHDINDLLSESGQQINQFCAHWLEGKTKLQSHHVTVAYFGDQIDPDLYCALFKMVHEENIGLVKVKIVSLHADDKAMAASVEISDDRLAKLCTQAHAHITLALAAKVKPFYSNELLTDKSAKFHIIKDEIIMVGGRLRGEGVSQSKSKKSNGAKGSSQSDSLPQLRSFKQDAQQLQWKEVVIASDIGGVIVESNRRTQNSDHDISRETSLVKNSVEALTAMAEAGYKLYLLSYCGEATEKKTIDFLLGNKVDQIVPQERWLFCRSRSDKVQLMQQHGIQMLIDDTATIIGKVRDAGLEGLHFGQEDTGNWSKVLQKLNLLFTPKQQSSTFSESLAKLSLQSIDSQTQ
ncbi:hypothetical protein MIR68_009169 [Amoeboaphelidium protococcarum]|nr:hypothetical protein MIR68_009169 [Amoeboaphelidium protococcarum]